LRRDLTVLGAYFYTTPSFLHHLAR
jgi:hypothetical protein